MQRHELVFVHQQPAIGCSADRAIFCLHPKGRAVVNEPLATPLEVHDAQPQRRIAWPNFQFADEYGLSVDRVAPRMVEYFRAAQAVVQDVAFSVPINAEKLPVCFRGRAKRFGARIGKYSVAGIPRDLWGAPHDIADDVVPVFDVLVLAVLRKPQEAVRPSAAIHQRVGVKQYRCTGLVADFDGNALG